MTDSFVGQLIIVRQHDRWPPYPSLSQVNGLEVAVEVTSSKEGANVPVIGGWHSPFSQLMLIGLASRVHRHPLHKLTTPYGLQ